MEVNFLAPAQAELDEAAAYYETQREGLGAQFIEEVKRAIQRILQYPDAWAPISRRTRRCRTNSFLSELFIKSGAMLCSLSQSCTFIVNPGVGGPGSPRACDNSRFEPWSKNEVSSWVASLTGIPAANDSMAQ